MHKRTDQMSNNIERNFETKKVEYWMGWVGVCGVCDMCPRTRHSDCSCVAPLSLSLSSFHHIRISLPLQHTLTERFNRLHRMAEEYKKKKIVEKLIRTQCSQFQSFLMLCVYFRVFGQGARECTLVFCIKLVRDSLLMYSYVHVVYMSSYTRLWNKINRPAY